MKYRKFGLMPVISWITLIFFLSGVFPRPVLAQVNDLSAGIAAYHGQDYEKAITYLTKVVEDKSISGRDLLKAYTYLSYAAFFQNKMLQADDAARNVFLLDPDFQPDTDSQELIRFFAGIKKDMLNTIRISSYPEGADIYLNDKLIGQTPFIVKNIEPGLHFFKFKKGKHQDMEKSIYIEPATINRLEVNLKSARSKKWIWYLVGPVILGSAIATGIAMTGERDTDSPDLLGEPPPPPQ